MGVQEELLMKLDSAVAATKQEEKNTIYESVKTLRAKTDSLEAKVYDHLGYNQLHWAIVCNQPADEITRLIDEEKVDVNEGTKAVKPLTFFNLSPLYLAVREENTELTQLLLGKGAEKDLTPTRRVPLNGILGGGAEYHEKEAINVSNFPGTSKNPTFRFFEQRLVEKRALELSDMVSFKYLNDLNIISATLCYCEDSVANYIRSYFKYPHAEELAACDEFKELLGREEDTDDWRSELRCFEKKHPAIAQDEQGAIYKASMQSRMM